MPYGRRKGGSSVARSVRARRGHRRRQVKAHGTGWERRYRGSMKDQPRKPRQGGLFSNQG
jgi:hypothetical protein